MPGGVCIHTHIVGAKVNASRSMRPEDKVPESNMKHTKLTRSGTGLSVLSTWKSGYLYAKMGYTTCAFNYSQCIQPYIYLQQIQIDI